MKTILSNSAKLAIAVLCLFSTFTAFSQEAGTTTKNYDQGWRLGFGLSGGVPFQDPYDFNLGGDIRLQYDLSRRYSLTLTSGFNNFFVKGDNNDLGYIPVKLGFKAFVLKERLYLMGEVGEAFAVTNGYKDNSVLLSPGIGYANDYFDVSLRYEHYPNFPILNNDNTTGTGLGQIALRFAYGFRL